MKFSFLKKSTLLSLGICLFTMINTCVFADSIKKEVIANSAYEICPVLIGTKIPEVILSKLDGTPYNLLESVKQKPAILVFFRGTW